ncbi:MAG: MFS transporter [Pseudomonadota bacterium]
MSLPGVGAVHRVHIHYAIQAFAAAAGGVFVVAYLLKAGVPVPIALLFQAGIVALRFLIRPLTLPLAKRFGIKPLLMAGTIITGVDYPLLALVDGPGPMLWALCAFSSIGYLLYWLCYHAYFAALGGADDRGGQIGVREAIVALVGVVAPLLGGWGLTSIGPTQSFWLVGAIQACAVLPLIGLPNVAVKGRIDGPAGATRMGLGLMVADGLFAAAYHYVWLIALFVALDQNYLAYGAAFALAALVGAASGVALGRHVDTGHGRRAVWIAYGAAAVVVAMRAASLDLPWLAVAANAAGAFLVAVITPVLMTPVYNMAKASPCVMRFHIATEGAWDIGCFLGCTTAAALAWAGLPLGVPILMGLAAAAALIALLRRYYGRLAPG